MVELIDTNCSASQTQSDNASQYSANLTKLVSGVLNRIVEKNCFTANIQSPPVDHFIIFKSSYEPDVSIEAYLERIRSYSKCSDSCLVFTLIYIDRLIESKQLVLSRLNIHRILITCMMLASKYHDDLFYNNAYFARLGGLSLQELNSLEVNLLTHLDYSLFINNQVYENYLYQVEHYNFPLKSVVSCVLPPLPSPQGVDMISPHYMSTCNNAFQFSPHTIQKSAPVFFVEDPYSQQGCSNMNHSPPLSDGSYNIPLVAPIGPFPYGMVQTGNMMHYPSYPYPGSNYPQMPNQPIFNHMYPANMHSNEGFSANMMMEQNNMLSRTASFDTDYYSTQYHTPELASWGNTPDLLRYSQMHYPQVMTQNNTPVMTNSIHSNHHLSQPSIRSGTPMSSVEAIPLSSSYFSSGSQDSYDNFHPMEEPMAHTSNPMSYLHPMHMMRMTPTNIPQNPSVPQVAPASSQAPSLPFGNVPGFISRHFQFPTSIPSLAPSSSSYIHCPMTSAISSSGSQRYPAMSTVSGMGLTWSKTIMPVQF